MAGHFDGLSLHGPLRQPRNDVGVRLLGVELILNDSRFRGVGEPTCALTLQLLT